MTKPSEKKTARKAKRPATRRARKPAQPKPQVAPEGEELKQEIAKFDHDGDGHVGGSLPHATPAEDAVETTVEAEAPKREAPDKGALSETVALGPVECRMRRLPIEKVLGLLSPDGLRRIEAEQSTASFESTCQRLLATDGRATPVVFASAELAGGQPTILHGFAEIAAAQVSGVPDIPVILVPAGGASAAQSHIVEMVRQQRAKGQTSDDDELFYRVHAEG